MNRIYVWNAGDRPIVALSHTAFLAASAVLARIAEQSFFGVDCPTQSRTETGELEMAICSYCEQDKKLTDEHVWSSIVLRLFDPVAPITIDEKRGKAYRADPVIKDLCGDCNAGTSAADTAMGKFAKRYLVGRLDREYVVHFDNPNILRWVMKTVSNHERCLKVGSNWWKGYVSFFKGAAANTSQVDLLLAPWVDLSPERVASTTCAVLTLGAKRLVLAALKTIDPHVAHEKIVTSWVLKVGSGVFVFILWKADAPDEVRRAVVAELRDFGWLLSGQDDVVGRIPFNALSCTQYEIPADPNELDFLGVFRNLGIPP